MVPSSQKAAPYNHQSPSSQKKPAERLVGATFSPETFYTVAQFGLRQELPYLAAVLFGAVGAADRRSGYGAGELGVGAQHGVWFSRAGRTELPDAWWELGPRMVLQDVGLPLAGTFINLQVQMLCRESCTQFPFPA